MPVKRCQKNGKKGHKCGDDGKCYTGKDSRKKAQAQCDKIHLEKEKRGK